MALLPQSEPEIQPQAGRRASDSQMPPPINTAPDRRPSNFARDGFMKNARPRPDAIAQPESMTQAMRIDVSAHDK